MKASVSLEEFALALRFLIGFVLLTAALPKLVALSEFERAVSDYRLLPAVAVRPAAHAIPILEGLVGLGMLVGIYLEAFSLAASVLLLGFALAVATNLLKGRRIDCGCRGNATPTQIGWAVVAVDLVLCVCGVVAGLLRPGVLALPLGHQHLASSTLTSWNGVAILLAVALALLAKAVGGAALRLRTQMEASLIVREVRRR